MRIHPVVLIGLLLLMGGCAAGTQRLTSTTYSPHTNPVFVTKASLPPDSFEPVADLEESKGWYGSTDNTQQVLADRARELGADAVLNMKSLRAHDPPRRPADCVSGDVQERAFLFPSPKTSIEKQGRTGCRLLEQQLVG